MARDGATEVRLNDDGTLDEVCAWGFVHLEQMDTTCWLLMLDTADGKSLRIPIWSKAKVQARADDDGASDHAVLIADGVRAALAKQRRRINKNRKRVGMKALLLAACLVLGPVSATAAELPMLLPVAVEHHPHGWRLLHYAPEPFAPHEARLLMFCLRAAEPLASAPMVHVKTRMAVFLP